MPTRLRLSTWQSAVKQALLVVGWFVVCRVREAAHEES